MNELRRFLGALFGFVAFSCLLEPFSSLMKQIHGPHYGFQMLVGWFAGTAFLIGSSLLNALACWFVLTNRPLARIFGTAASTLPFVGMLVFTILGLAYHSQLPPFSLFLTALALAVAGLIAFLPRNRTKPTDAKPSTPIQGDGTNRWLGKSIWIIGTIAFLTGLRWWWHWAQIQGLAWIGGASFFLLLVLIDLVIVLLHELGHTITDLALGMKLRAFIVGPFQWRVYQGKWEFKFRPSGFFSTGGTTGLVPTNPLRSVWEQVCMIAAGPLFSLISGVLALWAALAAPGRAWEPVWPFFACVATVSLLVGVLNLVPFQTGTTYSDGAQIYQLLSGGPWADYHRAMAVVSSTLVTPLRLRDYDIGAIQRAAVVINTGHRGMHLRLLASSHHLDRGAFREAARSLAEAELVFQRSELKALPSGWHAAITYDKAMLHHDAVGARQWWEQMQSEKSIRFKVDHWLGQSALLWIENNHGEAREAWEKANALAQKLPNFGAYEFDRYRCSLLRKALDDPSPAEVAEPLPLSGSTLATLPPDPLPAS